jgi:hypothetical protein
MSVRHEVENLIRRGNIFYWRPRIPSCFAACTPGSRLSLSLQMSDHKKAKVMARQLNLRLAEMKLKSKDIMSTKEQLQRLFKHALDDMLEKLDDVSTMAKRNGRAGDVVEMELDLEVGWALQLLAKFGTRTDLTLEGNCTGLAYLLISGVPISHVAAVKANYLGELKIARSPAFQDSIWLLMFNFDIPDTTLNHEKAMSRVFEGRAAALLDIDQRHELVDKSLSEFTGGGRTDAQFVATVPITPAEPAISVPIADPVQILQPASAIATTSEPKVEHLDLTPRPQAARSKPTPPVSNHSQTDNIPVQDKRTDARTPK